MKILGVIPARMNSSRFKGKPLAKIHGLSMIGHCYLRSKMCSDLTDLYVATCDKEIFDYIHSIGGKAVMTSADHDRASDRSAEAMLEIEKKNNFKFDIVTMIQGDEPMLTPSMISESFTPIIKNENIRVTNLMSEIDEISEFQDPNEVKVVVNKKNEAIYFSREPIPSTKKSNDAIIKLKQVCIISFKRDFLIKFNEMEQTLLEKIESIDMLRVIENNEIVKMVLTKTKTWSVDTIEDLEKVENKMKHDELMKLYNI
jgi:3-deoxy-manno-octulosonate cytidylyltransferase (CMP-KDO synthetase)